MEEITERLKIRFQPYLVPLSHPIIFILFILHTPVFGYSRLCHMDV